jgi:hypothetical protein
MFDKQAFKKKAIEFFAQYYGKTTVSVVNPFKTSIENKNKEVFEKSITKLIEESLKDGKIAEEERKGKCFLKDLESLIPEDSIYDEFRKEAMKILADEIQKLDTIKDKDKLPRQSMLEMKIRIDAKNSVLTQADIESGKESGLTASLAQQKNIDRNSFPESYDTKKYSQFYEDTLLLGKTSNFYQYFMNKSSSELAKIMHQSKASANNEENILDQVRDENIIKNMPSDLQYQLSRVIYKHENREQSFRATLSIKDSFRSIKKNLTTFFGLLRNRKIPEFQEALKDIKNCASYEDRLENALNKLKQPENSEKTYEPSRSSRTRISSGTSRRGSRSS